jgi:hypothetical protein
MEKNIVHVSRRRRILAGWAAAACGLVMLGTTATTLLGDEPSPHRTGHYGAGQLQPVSSDHSRAADQVARRFGRTSLQKVDTAGLWDDYQRGGPYRHSAPRPVAAAVCECDRGGHLNNPLFRVLDGFAGGIEQAVGLDRQSSLRHEATCDDGCDAVTRKELRQLDVRAVPMVKPIVPAPRVDKPANAGAKRGHVPEGSPPESQPDEPQDRLLPKPVHPDSEIDPFADEAAWTPGRNPAIERSAYFE